MSTPSQPHWTTAAPPKRGRIWHVSDLHFHPDRNPGAPDAKDKPTAAAPGAFDTDAFQHLLALAAEKPANVLVLSGDFVQGSALAAAPPPPAALAPASTRTEAILRWLGTLFGNDEEEGAPAASTPPAPSGGISRRRQAFERAVAFARSLSDAHGLGDRLASHVVVCPGNHDVDWVAALEAAPGDASPASLAEFEAAMQPFLRPSVQAPFCIDEDTGVCVLTLDTAYLGGTQFARRDRNSPEDAPAYSPMLMRQAFAAARRAHGGAAAVPEGMLGILVAHHPPSVTPTAYIEIKAFETAIGAAQAKDELHRAGFRVVLHGHKHKAVVQEERVRVPGHPEAARMAIISAPTLLDTTGALGFYVIETAVAPLCGEARLLVTHYDFADFRPRATEPPILIVVPPRSRGAAKRVRVVEFIGVDGDGRTDFSIHDLPVPRRGASETLGWTWEQGQWVRIVPRAVDVPTAHTTDPSVAPLCAGVTASAAMEHDNHRGARSWNLRVAADPSVTRYASVMERTVTAHCYAVSEVHQQRIYGSPDVLPQLPSGWETLVHVMRQPAEMLEFSIHLPFAVPYDLPVRVRTYTETPDGSLATAEGLEEFSLIRVEKVLAAKRIRVWVEHPLMGVAYSVEWKLPIDHPDLVARERVDGQKYSYAVLQAERLRLALVQARETPAGRELVRQMVRRQLEPLFERLREAGAVEPEEELEWALYVPNQPLPTPGTLQTSGPVPRPELVPVAANYEAGDPRWDATWKAGMGVVGRAYALNQTVRYVGPTSVHFRPRRQDPWNSAEVPVYQPLDGHAPHSALWAVNVLHPTRKQGDVNWAALSVGTSRRDALFTLDVLLPTPEDGEGTSRPAHILLSDALVRLAREVWTHVTAGPQDRGY